MSHRIRIIHPWGVDFIDQPVLEAVAPFLHPSTDVSVSNLGEDAVQLPWPAGKDRDLAIEAAVRAEREGMEAIVIGCAADPFVKDVRQAVSIPVVGLMETAVIDSRVRGKLAIFPRRLKEEWLPYIAEDRNWEAWQERAHGYGLSDDEYTMRQIQVPEHPAPETLERLKTEDPKGLYEVMIESMTAALLGEGVQQVRSAAEEGARSGYFACAYWSPALIEHGEEFRGTGLRAVNPVISGITYAEHLVLSAA